VRAEVDVVWGVGDGRLGFDQARLQVDYVVSQLIVLGLDDLEVLREELVVADLLL
jgi:hypothetical protein